MARMTVVVSRVPHIAVRLGLVSDAENDHLAEPD
jgi:hypothetical protein